MYDYEWDRLKTWLQQYVALDKSITSAQDITRLDLSAKSLKEIPKSIGMLSKLLVLNLSNNKLSSLPESMKNLTSLKNLDIRRNAFNVLPDFIAHLNLGSLNASGNQLENIDVLKSCKGLKVLDLSANALGKLENFMNQDNELRTLNLSSNLIKDMRAFLPHLHHVERLNLSNNLLVSIPEEISCLQSIEELEFSSNQIEKIEDAFFDLEVEIVNLSDNNLKELHLYSLASLEELTLDENDFTKLSLEDNFAPYLKEFSCDSCSLTKFLLPQSKSLELLCYSSNKITAIPHAISRYEKLAYLDIEANCIEDLPDTLANLVYLQTFYVQGNPLREHAKKVVEVLSPKICDLNMKSGITIELARVKDLSQMAELLSVLFTIEKDFKIDFEKQLAGIEALYECEGADLLVAKYENSVIGMITMQRLISSAEGGLIGQIEDLVVYEEYRQMGVGSRLINKIRVIAQEHGYKRIQLAADVDNSHALAFYNRRGFNKTNLNIYHYIV
jgi:Leucine-rich repeat (LRR) protein